MKDEKDQNLTAWPEFHNGVSAGLKLSKEIININQESLKTWIFYQKPETLEFSHGGFLLGLGMLGDSSEKPETLKDHARRLAVFGDFLAELEKKVDSPPRKT